MTTASISSGDPPDQICGWSPKVLGREIRDLLLDLLGNDTSGTHAETPLHDVGLDSLSSMDFRKSLQNKVGMTLPSTFAFDHPTIRDMVEHIIPQQAAEQTQASPTADARLGALIPFSSAQSTIVAASHRATDISYEELLPAVMSGADTIISVTVNPGLQELLGSELEVHGSFLEEFEVAPIFSISAAEAAVMSPQQRIMLQVG
jgi:acyl carrier protein